MSRFDTTHWSVVSAAASVNDERARPALNVLCQTYWRPLHQYLCHSGCSDDDARDLTQSFLASFIERRSVAHANKARGRFRAYLLASLRHFLFNDLAARRALKRGGRTASLSVDAMTEVDRVPELLMDRRTPERVFDRQWAMTVLLQVTERLRTEWADAGKAHEFDVLSPALAGDRVTGGYAAMADALGTTEGAVKVGVHRMRRRYRRYLQETIAHTVASPDEVAAEIRYLLDAVSNV